MFSEVHFYKIAAIYVHFASRRSFTTWQIVTNFNVGLLMLIGFIHVYIHCMWYCSLYIGSLA